MNFSIRLRLCRRNSELVIACYLPGCVDLVVHQPQLPLRRLFDNNTDTLINLFSSKSSLLLQFVAQFCYKQQATANVD